MSFLKRYVEKKQKMVSEDYLRIWNSQSVTRSEYQFWAKETKTLHEAQVIKTYFYTWVLFISGLVAVYFQSFVFAVLLLALAANYNRQSSHHMLAIEWIDYQGMMVKLLPDPPEPPNSLMDDDDQSEEDREDE